MLQAVIKNGKEHRTYSYDNGLLKSVKRAGSDAIEYAYNSRGQLQRIKSAEGSIELSFDEDRNGRPSLSLAEHLEEGAVCQLGIDSAGRRSFVVRSSNGVARRIEQSADGRSTRWEEPTGTIQELRRDEEQGRRKLSYFQNGHRVCVESYDQDGKTDCLTIGDSLQIRPTFDELGILEELSLSELNAAASSNHRTQIRFDDRGRIISRLDVRGTEQSECTIEHDDEAHVMILNRGDNRVKLNLGAGGEPTGIETSWGTTLSTLELPNGSALEFTDRFDERQPETARIEFGAGRKMKMIGFDGRVLEARRSRGDNRERQLLTSGGLSTTGAEGHRVYTSEARTRKIGGAAAQVASPRSLTGNRGDFQPAYPVITRQRREASNSGQ